MGLKVLITDDSEQIRQNTRSILEKYCDNVSQILEAGSVKECVMCIERHAPDIVLMDVEMPDGTGFDALQQLNTSISFKLIFVTAHEKYAVRAFKFSAIDYLLKPFERKHLIDAIQRAVSMMEKKSMNLKLEALLSNIKSPGNSSLKLVLKTAEHIFSVNVNDVVHCESFKNYVHFHLNDGRKIVVLTTLKEYEELLIPEGFFRTHQSHLINMSYFDYYIKGDEGKAILKGGATVPISIRKKDDLIKLISKK